MVENSKKSQGQLLQESIQALHMDWTIDRMPCDTVKSSPTSRLGGPKPRKSPRNDFLRRASGAVTKVKSVLGKRGRDAIEASKESLQGLSKRVNLRPRGRQSIVIEESAKKRTRLSDEVASQKAALGSESKPLLVPRRKTKIWLTKGLYVGQERDFDARLSDSKNKLKRVAAEQKPVRQRKILPLPMFAGQRTLERGRDFKLPFNIFSPLPPGQPKPEEWKKTRGSTQFTTKHSGIC
jgi:histone-lysine N-methyltransferase ASH1L